MAVEPLILALETASRVGSVALAVGPELLAETTFSGPMQHSAEIFPTITTLLQRFARTPTQIRQIHISIGPGSFTGLRIAVAIAKTMHLANKTKIVPVNTLDVIAANVVNLTPQNPIKPCDAPAHHYRRIAPLLDAKRGQFYTALFECLTTDAADTLKDHIPNPCNPPDIPPGATGHTWTKTRADSLMTTAQIIEQFTDSQKQLCLLGDGLLYHQDKFQTAGIQILDPQYWSPKASNVHLLGWQKALAGQFADPLTLTPHYVRLPEAEEKWLLRTPQ